VDEIVSITRFSLHEGRADDFKRLFERCREIVEREDTGTLQYQAYLGDDESEAVILERYEDSEAVLEHLAHIGGDLMGQMMATATVQQEALGRPSAELAAAVQEGSVRFFAPVDGLQQ